MQAAHQPVYNRKIANVLTIYDLTSGRNLSFFFYYKYIFFSFSFTLRPFVLFCVRFSFLTSPSTFITLNVVVLLCNALCLSMCLYVYSVVVCICLFGFCFVACCCCCCCCLLLLCSFLFRSFQLFPYVRFCSYKYIWVHIVDDRWQVLTLTILYMPSLSVFITNFAFLSILFSNPKDMPSLYMLSFSSCSAHVQHTHTHTDQLTSEPESNSRKTFVFAFAWSHLGLWCNDTETQYVSSISLTEYVRELWTECENLYIHKYIREEKKLCAILPAKERFYRSENERCTEYIEFIRIKISFRRYVQRRSVHAVWINLRIASSQWRRQKYTHTYTHTRSHKMHSNNSLSFLKYWNRQIETLTFRLWNIQFFHKITVANPNKFIFNILIFYLLF